MAGLPKVYLFWYTFAVSYYEQIYDEAIGNNGLITTRRARELGIPAVELVKLRERGKSVVRTADLRAAFCLSQVPALAAESGEGQKLGFFVQCCARGASSLSYRGRSH